MAETREDEIRQLVDRVYRAESSRILATLIRLLGEFDLAEEAMQDAFAAALVRCSRDGAPENPRAWLIEEGVALVERALNSHRFGSYTLQQQLRRYILKRPARRRRIGHKSFCSTALWPGSILRR